MRRFLEEPGEVLERLREQHDAANDSEELEVLDNLRRLLDSVEGELSQKSGSKQ